MKNKFLLLILALVLIKNTHAQKSLSKTEQFFTATCKKIATALINKDLKTLNSYTHPGTGLYVIYKPGIHPAYLHLTETAADTMNFSLESEYNDSNFSKLNTLQFIKFIQYNCGTGWSKKGSLIAFNKYKPLTEINNFWKKDARENNYENSKIKSTEISRINTIEKNIRKIVFTNVGRGMVFYMSFINNKWYLTIIDQAETNCDG